MRIMNGHTLLRFVSPPALAMMAIVTIPSARASTNLFNVYIGAAYGHARVRASDSGLIASLPGSRLGSVDVGGSAYQITAGVRGLDLLGAEIDYFDLGSGEASPYVSGLGTTWTATAHVAQKGEAAFAVLYLPVPVIDIYLKAGVARVTTDLSATMTPGPGLLPLPCPTCMPLAQVHGAVRTTETAFAAGAGVQWKFGNWAIRGDYERFAALGEHPSLVSVGATWSFL